MLDMSKLADQMSATFKKKKKNPVGIGTGEDIVPPPFYIKAPAPVKESIGHFPFQRVIQISGKPNSGKTTFGMLAMLEAQKGYFDEDQNYVEEPIDAIILVDTEGKFSKLRFKKMGGDPEKILKLGANTLEEAFFMLTEAFNQIFAMKADAKVLVVFDSLGGTPSEAEAGADADESIQLATAAKVIKRNLRVIVPKYVDKRNVLMLVINTNYANIGSVGRSNSGGDGLEFASAAIMQLGRIGDITETKGGKTIQTGIKSRLNVTKNHLQTKEYAVKKVDFEVYAYEVKAADPFVIKRGAEFDNGESSCFVVKWSKKNDELTLGVKEHGASEEDIQFLDVMNKEDGMKYLEENGYEQLL